MKGASKTKGSPRLALVRTLTIFPSMPKISRETVQADFNDPIAVVHYTRAAHFLGLWKSETQLIQRYFPDRGMRLLEAGCGAGRVTIGLLQLGFRHITAFDFAAELLDQAQALAKERDGTCIRFLNADATQLSKALDHEPPFDGALFMFNGMMQIPGRENRRAAMREIGRACRQGAPFLFTTHDRDASPRERALWRVEAQKWAAGEEDERLVEFGDRYFEDANGRVFMHLPDRQEILDDLAATGWEREFDILRSEIGREPAAVEDFSDECRFWVARKS
jgi:SAM-dependent methyltransferase